MHDVNFLHSGYGASYKRRLNKRRRNSRDSNQGRASNLWWVAHWGKVCYLRLSCQMMTLLQLYCQVSQWENFENRSAFDEVTGIGLHLQRHAFVIASDRRAVLFCRYNRVHKRAVLVLVASYSVAWSLEQFARSLHAWPPPRVFAERRNVEQKWKRVELIIELKRDNSVHATASCFKFMQCTRV